MCLTPITITIPRTEEKQSVPCGKCPKCFARRISGWSFRLMQEDKISDSSHFITLTYNETSAIRTKNGFLTLDKRHIQLFFKRLRKAHSKAQNANAGAIKYYAAGEYGGKTFRPHYHIILFNARVDLVEQCWGHGHIDYGTVSCASVGYTLKYICKKKKIPMHRNDDRQPEFSLMSKNWGLITLPAKSFDGIITIY